MVKTHAIGVRLDPEVKAELEKMAEADSRSLSTFIALVLKRYVEEARKPKRARP